MSALPRGLLAALLLTACGPESAATDSFPDPATCDDYPGSVGVAELQIGILNLRSTPVFVHSNPDAIERRVLLSGDLGGRVVHAPYICDDDPPPCEELITGDLPGCPLIGFLPAPLRLEPGARHILRWTPYLTFPVLLPAACQPEFSADHTCSTAVPPAPGAYTLSLTYAGSCTGPCTCELASDGSCILDVQPDTVFADPRTARANYDGVCAIVDIVIA